MTTLERPVRPRRVHYPESDGKPMGETDLHRDLMTDLIFALKWFLRSTRAYVAGNLFIYYEEGNPRAAVAPDVFVALGVEQRRRPPNTMGRSPAKSPRGRLLLKKLKHPKKKKLKTNPKNHHTKPTKTPQTKNPKKKKKTKTKK
jgi:hypothetical protein